MLSKMWTAHVRLKTAEYFKIDPAKKRMAAASGGHGGKRRNSGHKTKQKNFDSGLTL